MRLGFKLPFQVDYDRLQQLFYADRFFERPGPANLTVFETREPLPSGAGPLFRYTSADHVVVFLPFLPHDRIERNDFSQPPFRASFCIFRSGKVQARCSKIPADVTAMIAVCKDVHSILGENRSAIEAFSTTSVGAQQRGKSASPPRAPFPTQSGKSGSPPTASPSPQLHASSAVCYPKGMKNFELIACIHWRWLIVSHALFSFRSRQSQTAARNDDSVLQI